MRRGSAAFPFAMALGAISSSMLGCSVDASTADPENATASSPTKAEIAGCQKGTVKKSGSGEKVVVCTEPFAEAPFIRPPADDLTGPKVKFYAGITVPTTVDNSFVVFARDGEMFVPVDSSGKPIPFTSGSKLPKALHAPTNRVTFTIYQLAGTTGDAIESPYGSATALKLSSARPVYSIPGCAFDGGLLGSWEGTVSQRLSKPSGSGPWAKAFDESKRVPIRVTIDHADPSNPLVDYDGKKALSDETTYMLSGTIDNFDKDVTIGTKKFGSLKALGDKNPFYGATSGTVQLYRLGNMHGTQNDGHWVLTYPSGAQNLTGNGMSYTLTARTAPAFLFEPGVSADPIERILIKPHIPYTSNGHTVELVQTAADGSLDLCAP